MMSDDQEMSLCTMQGEAEFLNAQGELAKLRLQLDWSRDRDETTETRQQTGKRKEPPTAHPQFGPYEIKRK